MRFSSLLSTPISSTSKLSSLARSCINSSAHGGTPQKPLFKHPNCVILPTHFGGFLVVGYNKERYFVAAARVVGGGLKHVRGHETAVARAGEELHSVAGKSREAAMHGPGELQEGRDSDTQVQAKNKKQTRSGDLLKCVERLTPKSYVQEMQSEGSKVAEDSKVSQSEEVPVTIKVSEDLGQLEPMGPDTDVKDGLKVERSMWSKLGQRFNPVGLQFAAHILLWDQHLVIPHVSVPDIRWIDWKALRKQGFEGVVFDKDNTITAPYALTVWPALATSLQECQSVFEGRIALLSNSAGLYQFDPDGIEAKALEERLGLKVIRHATKKPAGTAEDIAKHFGCEPSRLIMVGDRYFTDVAYGNNNGMLTIRPAPLTPIGEPYVVQQVRAIEDAMVGRWLSQGVQPKAHALYITPHDFIKDPACW